MAEKPIDLPVEAESAPDPEEDDLSDLDGSSDDTYSHSRNSER